MAAPWSKHRFQIWNQTQHPYKHNLAEFGFSNPAMPGVDNVEEALNWIMAVLYPQSQSAVQLQTDLPADAPVTFSGGRVQGANAAFTIDDELFFTNAGGALPAPLLPNVTYRVSDTVGGLELSDLDGNPILIIGGGTGVHTLHSPINAYRVVFDDGDGKAAGYRWEQREGEASPSWHKIYDMDWSEDNILAQFMNITQDLYVYKNGKDDADPLGAPIVGPLAGQHVFGGASANTNLILHANSGDGVGARTGAVKVDDQFQPTVDDLLDIGTALLRFKDLFLSNTILVDTMTIASGSITDTTGAIDFDDEDLTTTGDVSATNVNASTSVNVGADMHITNSQITNDSGTISFDDEDLSTLGSLTVKDIALTGGSTISETTDLVINSLSSTIDFSNNALININSLDVGALTADSLVVDDLTLDNNEVASASAIELSPDISDPNVNVNGNLNVSNNTVLTGSLEVNGATELQAVKLNGPVTSDNPTITVDPSIVFSADQIQSEQIGTVADPVNNIVANNLVAPNGDVEPVQDIVDFPFTATLQDDVPHWDTATQKFINKQIDFPEHGELVGLADDDHLQYALLAGRTGGQTLAGAATAGAGSLTLIGQAGALNANSIILQDKIVPHSNAVFGAGWTGYDIGTSSLNFNDIYTKGQHYGLRFENVVGLPAANAANVGRVVFDTQTNAMYIDLGGSWKAMMHTDAYTSTENGSGITLAANLRNIVNLTSAALVSISNIGLTAGVSGANYKVLVNQTGVIFNIVNGAGILTGTGADLPVPVNATVVLYYDGTNWRVASGSGSGSGTSGVEYITNGSGEQGTGGWTSYNDGATSRPVDGTGGVVTGVTFATTAVNPLRGNLSFLLSKDAANRQGMGVSYDFTIDRQDQGKVLTITKEYIVNSGTFVAGTSTTDGDVICYIYDITNGRLIEPSNIKMLSNSSTLSDRYQAEFQTATDSRNYRLITHIASTSTSAYEIKFEASVKPNTYIYGTPITDSISYTPTFGAGFGSVTNISFKYFRQGERLVVRGSFTTGTHAAAAASISIPAGFSVDTNKISLNNTTANPGSLVGDWAANGNNAYYANIVTAPATSATSVYLTSPGNGLPNVPNTTWSTQVGVNNIVIAVDFSVPVVGLSSSVQMSDSADTRVVAFAGTKVGGQAITANVTNITFVANKDTHAGWNGSTYTIPVPGEYIATMSGGASANTNVQVYVNGIVFTDIGAFVSAFTGSGAVLLQNLKAGDVVSLRGTSAATINTGSNFSISRISGPSAIAMSESVNAGYWLSSSQAVTANVTPINYDSKEFDSHNAVTTGAGWRFTAPISGLYSIQGTVNANALSTFNLYKNGTHYNYITTVIPGGAVGIKSISVKLLAGEYIEVRTAQSVTVSGTTLAAGGAKIYITRTGNY